MSKLNIPKSILNLEKRIKAGIKQGLQRSSIELAGVPNSTTGGLIKDEMNKPKTGIIYPVIVKKKRKYFNHQASNETGLESSAILSGELARSVRGKTLGSDRLEISANTPYAAIQEYGGFNKLTNRNYWLSHKESTKKNYFRGKIAPRNNLIRPITESRGNIINNIKQGIDSSKK